MKPNGSEDIYRVAFDSAHTELNEILVSFEELRLRKERIEKVVAALKPLLGMEPDQSAAQSAEGSEGEPSAEEAAPESGDLSSDPFQRRIDLALREGTAGRDVRKFSRQFHEGHQLRGK